MQSGFIYACEPVENLHGFIIVLYKGMKYRKKNTECTDLYKYMQQNTDACLNHVGREKQSVPKYGSRTKTLHRETGNIQDKISAPSTPMCNTNLSGRLTNSSTSEANNYIESTPNHQRNKLHCPDASLDSSVHGFPKFSSARSSPASGQGFLAKGTASGLKGSSPNMQWVRIVRLLKYVMQNQLY